MGIEQAKVLLKEPDDVSRIVDITNPGTIGLAIRAQNAVFTTTSQALNSFSTVRPLA